MIYLHVNKRTVMLSLATSYLAHLCNQLNHVALPIFMPRFEAIFFIKIALKLSYFCKKCKIFDRWGLRPQTTVPPAAGAFAPRPPASGCWWLRPHTPIGLRRLGSPPSDPRTQSPIANFWLRACTFIGL